MTLNHIVVTLYIVDILYYMKYDDYWEIGMISYQSTKKVEAGYNPRIYYNHDNFVYPLVAFRCLFSMIKF
jgi:hypothetical protein